MVGRSLSICHMIIDNQAINYLIENPENENLYTHIHPACSSNSIISTSENLHYLKSKNTFE